jgi:beta-N-acetylhexosaminidase
MSPQIINDIIRGAIGFDGLLMSDDLDMQALSGDVSDRAANCVAAGCDIALNCWGRMDEMIRIVDKLPEITARAKERLLAAMSDRIQAAPQDELAGLLAKRDALLAQAADNTDTKLTKAATGASHG